MVAWRWSHTLIYAYNLHFKSSRLRQLFFGYLFSLPGMSDNVQVSEDTWLRAERAGIPFQKPGGCMSCISCSPLTPWAKNNAVASARLEQMTIYPVSPRTEQG